MTMTVIPMVVVGDVGGGAYMVLLLASTLVALGPYLEEKSLFCPI